MIVMELPCGAVAVQSGTHRPAGLHCSQIIKSLCQHLDPKTYGKPLDLQKVALGLSFEEALEASFQSAATGTFRPDPILVPPGIWCSLDGVCPDPFSVEEFKLTWYSAKKECPTDPVYWPWLVQIKAYCHAIDTRLAKLWVMHINGDYKPPRPWQPRVYGIEFGEIEIQENWSLLTNHAKGKGWL